MRWDTLEKNGLFATKDIQQAIQYVDDIVQTNSVINYYETNMICTTKEEKK